MATKGFEVSKWQWLANGKETSHEIGEVAFLSTALLTFLCRSVDTVRLLSVELLSLVHRCTL